MVQNDWGGKIGTSKNCWTAASVWKGWRPDLIFREFFADQNVVNFRNLKGTAASVWKGWRPDLIFREFSADQIKSNSEKKWPSFGKTGGPALNW